MRHEQQIDLPRDGQGKMHVRAHTFVFFRVNVENSRTVVHISCYNNAGEALQNIPTCSPKYTAEGLRFVVTVNKTSTGEIGA